MIEQIIMNLATNASDAMPNGGVLSITGHTVDLDPSQAGQMNISPGTYVHLSFADTGEGMDERTMSQVFDPFFTTKEVGKGTGLGLSTVFGAVKSHGGTITCQSGPGEGAVFNLYFPVADQASAEPPAQQTAPENLHGNGELVLIIDDEQDLLDIGQRILLRHGYRAMTAPDGEKGLEILRGGGADRPGADGCGPAGHWRAAIAGAYSLHQSGSARLGCQRLWQGRQPGAHPAARHPGLRAQAF